MGCYDSPTFVRVWLDALGRVAFDFGKGAAPYNPTEIFYKPYEGNTGSTYDDRISIYTYGGLTVFEGYYPDWVRNEAGEKIGGLADLVEYFDGLGIGQPSGGGSGGITPEQLNTILQGYVTKTEYNTLVQRVLILEQSAGYTQVDTPVVDVSNITSNSALVSWGAVDDATGYELYLNATDASPIATLQADQLSYQLSGLTPQTPYTPAVKALAILPFLPSDLGIKEFTTQSGQQPGNTNIFPLTFPFQFAS